MLWTSGYCLALSAWRDKVCAFLVSIVIERKSMKKKVRKSKASSVSTVESAILAFSKLPEKERDLIYAQVSKSVNCPVVPAGLDQELQDWIKGLSLDEIQKRAELLGWWSEQLYATFSLGTLPESSRVNLFN